MHARQQRAHHRTQAAGASCRRPRRLCSARRCYHLTDLPSFVSSQHLVIFDPHARYLPGASAAQPGLRVNLARGQLAATFPDALAPYRHFGCTMEVRPRACFCVCLRAGHACEHAPVRARNMAARRQQHHCHQQHPVATAPRAPLPLRPARTATAALLPVRGPTAEALLHSSTPPTRLGRWEDCQIGQLQQTCNRGQQTHAGCSGAGQQRVSMATRAHARTLARAATCVRSHASAQHAPEHCAPHPGRSSALESERAMNATPAPAVPCCCRPHGSRRPAATSATSARATSIRCRCTSTGCLCSPHWQSANTALTGPASVLLLWSPCIERKVDLVTVARPGLCCCCCRHRA